MMFFLVQRICYNVPQVLLDGLVAVRAVLLRLERLLVLHHLLNVLATRSHSLADTREQGASSLLFSADRSRAGDFRADVHTVAVRVRGRRGTVRTKQHLRTTVLTVLTGFR